MVGWEWLANTYLEGKWLSHKKENVSLHPRENLNKEA
jgi:hypothetical protein